MRRRLLVTIVGAVAVALVLAGLGTLTLAAIDARRAAEDDLKPQARAIATAMRAAAIAGIGSGIPPRRSLGAAGQVLRQQGVGLVLVTAGDQVILLNGLPDSVDLADLDAGVLRAGGTLSGNHGSRVWAAAGSAGEQFTFAAVVTGRADPLLGRAWGWFLLAAAGTLALAVLVAVRRSRELVEPLRRADDATRRMAAGDLAVRLPEPPPGETDELAQLTRSINAMAAALERSQGLEREFLLSVSHDLRTPLTSIRGWAEAVADGTAPDPAAAAGVVLAEAGRLDRLVTDLLELARLEAHAFSLAVGPVDATAVVGATVEGLRPGIEGDGLAVRVDGATWPVPVWADGDRLAQVVANLVENAAKFAASAVQVSVLPMAGGAWVAVDDDGPGIAAEDLPHVFERLYVARHRPRRKEVGSGLGLAIVRELVTAMGGTVRAERAPGGGARMLVWLQAAPQPTSGSSSTLAGASPPGQRTVTPAGGDTARPT